MQYGLRDFGTGIDAILFLELDDDETLTLAPLRRSFSVPLRPSALAR